MDEAQLSKTPEGDSVKGAIAREIRPQTPKARSWMAERLKMGNPALEP